MNLTNSRTFLQKIAIFLFMLTSFSVLPSLASADLWTDKVPTNSNVLCVYNANADISKQICEYYESKRPGSHTLGLNLSWGDFIHVGGTDDEIMSDDVFAGKVSQPVLDYLNSHPNLNITHLAVAKGVPFQVAGDNSVMPGNTFLSVGAGKGSSVKSLRTSSMELTREDRSNAKACLSLQKHFDPKDCADNQPIYRFRFAVSYLTGYTLKDIKILIDKAQAPAPNLSKVKWFLDQTAGPLATGKQDLGMDTPATVTGLVDLGVSSDNIVINKKDVVKVGDTLVQPQVKFDKTVVAYGGWGVWKGYNWGTWLTTDNTVQIPVANRAIIDVYESWFGLTATEGAWSDGNINQSRIAQAFRPNVFGGSDYSRSFSGGVGTISEPGASGVVKMSGIFPAYASGLTLAESLLYASNANEFYSPFGIAIGDPLMRISDNNTLIAPEFSGAPEIYTIKEKIDGKDISLTISTKSTNPNPFATVYWDDGSPTEKSEVMTSSENGRSVTIKHTFPKIGRYQVRYNISDSAGRESSWQVTYIDILPDIIPTLSIIAPVYKEKVTAGSTYTIQWTSSGITSNDFVILEIVPVDSGIGVESVLTESTSNSGAYEWKVPGDFISGRYWIRIACTVECALKYDMASVGGIYAYSGLFNIESGQARELSTEVGTSKSLFSLVKNLIGIGTRPSPSPLITPSSSPGSTAVPLRTPMVIKATPSMSPTPSIVATPTAVASNSVKPPTKSPEIVAPSVTPAASPVSSPPISSAYISVKSPNGGEVYTAGKAISAIRWSSENFPSGTSIDQLEFSLISLGGNSIPLKVMKSSAYLSGFNGNYVKDGISSVYNQLIPSTVPAGQYRLKIYCRSCGGTNDISDKTFTILTSTAVQSITVTSPYENQVVYAGDQMFIRWTSSNIPASEPLDITAFNRDNTTIAYTFARNLEAFNTGSYSVILPKDMKPGRYSIQVGCNNCFKTSGSLTFAWSPDFTVSSRLYTSPSATPATQPSATPSPVSTISATPTPTPVSTISTTPTPVGTVSATPTPTSTVGSTPTPTATIGITPTPTPTIGSSPTPTPTSSPVSFTKKIGGTASVLDALIEIVKSWGF